jgi:hypothetical protein
VRPLKVEERHVHLPSAFHDRDLFRLEIDDRIPIVVLGDQRELDEGGGGAKSGLGGALRSNRPGMTCETHKKSGSDQREKRAHAHSHRSLLAG